MDEHDVVELTCNEDRSRVTGVSISSRQSDEKRALTADLVVDATGRGSRTPTFLESLGYDRPVEDEVVMRLVYTSQLLQIPPGMYHELLVLTGPVPGRPTAMALFTYENDTWLLTTVGLAGDESRSGGAIPESCRLFLASRKPFRTFGRFSGRRRQLAARAGT
jgi:hypothetical protein